MFYIDGVRGSRPRYPVDFASLEEKAKSVLPLWVHSYVAGGSGDGHTQRANAEAFTKWGLVPRMFNGATERDLSVSLFGLDLPTPIFMAPSGGIGLCAQDFHGDLQVAEAAAVTAFSPSADHFPATASRSMKALTSSSVSRSPSTSASTAR